MSLINLLVLSYTIYRDYDNDDDAEDDACWPLGEGGGVCFGAIYLLF